MDDVVKWISLPSHVSVVGSWNLPPTSSISISTVNREVAPSIKLFTTGVWVRAALSSRISSFTLWAIMVKSLYLEEVMGHLGSHILFRLRLGLLVWYENGFAAVGVVFMRGYGVA